MALHKIIVFAIRLWLLLLGQIAVADTNVLREVHDDPSTTPTVTVTSTLTVTSLPLGPTTVTLTKTSTRSVWLSSVVIVESLNCTRTVFTTNPATASPALQALPEIETGFDITKRQGSESPTSTTTPILPTIPTSTVVAPTTSPRVTRTRTIWVVSTAVQTTPYSRTSYQCSFTLAYLLTTDATTTVPYTLTSYSSTVTATSTISCPFGLGGLGIPGALPTTAPLAPPFTTSGVTSSAKVGKVMRQITNSTTTLATTETGVSNSVRISTVHLTRTTYSVVLVNATAAATVQRYECSTSTYDTTVTYNLTRTAWPSTTTIVSVLACGLPSRPPVTSTRPTITLPPTLPASKVRRQTESTTDTSSVPVSLPPISSGTETTSTPSTSTTVHRTRYIFGTVTVTATVPTTRLVYSCAATTTVSASVS
ncbi:hypothetical protein BR93DRAFT_988761 [Coniochaeta sp. PMI_546]|nr:hypothetical protein BR93DRAFT_988761 [Coniochaeta sp. PMI_546]